jgi:hypothetical protein
MAKSHLATQVSNGSYKRLLDIAARMHREVQSADRFYHLIRYRKCFLGSEGVLWLIHDQKCSLEGAVALGNHMIDLKFFQHVSCEHFLCHAYLFYRFNHIALAESDLFQLPSTSTSSGTGIKLNTISLQS